MKIFTLRHSWPVILEAKRRESILLAMALAFAVFTACDSGSSSTDPDPIAEVSSSSDEVSKNSSSSQKSADKEKSSSSVEKSKSSSSEGEVASSSSKKDENSSSSVKKEDSSSSVVIASSSSSIKVDGSSASVKPESSSTVTSSATVASSSSVVEPSSSSEYVPYNHRKALYSDSVLTGAYKQFTDTRNGRSYYYLTINGKDKDGNSASVTVMAENLNIGEMVDGEDDQENDAKIERYCYDNDTTNCNMYGGLYQWAEMMQLPSRCNTESCADLIKPNHQGICPSGWRLLTYNDYYIVVHADNNEDGVKGTRSAYGFGGSNDSGYSLIGAGGRTDEGGVVSLNDATFWYYPREILSEGVFLPNAGYTSAYRNTMDGKDNCNYTKREGYSVRCVMVE